MPYTSTASISIHAPHGVRPSKLHIHQIPFAISIHAPHGVRLRRAGAKSWMALFQSTRHTGRDVPEDKYSLLLDKFQSTRHTGRDHGSQAARTRRNLFQSTRHTGRDVTIEVVYSTDTFISIHAPHRARLHYSFDSSLPSQISIHAPHRARHYGCSKPYPCCYHFNPRATQGATAKICNNIRNASL